MTTEGRWGLVFFKFKLKIKSLNSQCSRPPFGQFLTVITLVQNFQTNFPCITNTNHHLSVCVCAHACVWMGISLALHPARANSAIWTDDRMLLIYHRKSLHLRSTALKCSNTVLKEKVLKSRVAYSQFNRHWSMSHGSYSMSKTAKIRRAVKTAWKRWHSNGWNAGNFLKSRHPTQSSVKVHSMSTLNRAKWPEFG